MMDSKHLIISFFVYLTLLLLISCAKDKNRYDNDLFINKLNADSTRLFCYIKPDTIMLGDTAILTVARSSIKLKNLRGVIGKYDSDFFILEGSKEHSFYGDDYYASIFLVPSTARIHTYRGFMEEYEILNDSIEKLYRYKFEVNLVVLGKLND